MSRAKKTLLAAACACALVVGAVAGTVAYLTATTDTVTNTFTVGNVSFALGGGLDEAKVNEYGELLDDKGAVYKENNDQTLADRVAANSYKLVPGHEYVKDPTVHMKSGSEPAWVFVKVDDGISAIEDVTTVANQIKGNGWGQLVDDNGDAVAGVYYKDWSEATSPSNLDLVVFESFKIKADADISSYGGKTITVKAYAVQKDGFENALAAWTEAAKLDSSTPATPEDGE